MEGRICLMLLPLVCCWLQGRAEFMEEAGLWSYCELMGQEGMWLGGGSWLPLPGGRGCCCSFSMVHYLGSILRWSQSLCTEPSVPGASANRAEAGESAEAISEPGSCVGCCISGSASCALEPWNWGSLRRERTARDWVDSTVPGQLPGKSGPCLELLF